MQLRGREPRIAIANIHMLNGNRVCGSVACLGMRACACCGGDGDGWMLLEDVGVDVYMCRRRRRGVVNQPSSSESLEEDGARRPECKVRGTLRAVADTSSRCGKVRRVVGRSFVESSEPSQVETFASLHSYTETHTYTISETWRP